LVKDINTVPAAASSNPQNFAPVGSTIFFSASGAELWKTDGTAAGTVLVQGIFPGFLGSRYPGNA